MSISSFSTSPSARLLRPALAVAALMACSVAAQAADPVGTVVAPVNAAVTAGTKTIVNGKIVANAPANNNGANANANASTEVDATAAAKGETTTSATGKAVSDTWITTKVKSEIVANSATKGLKVHVTTKSGVVALTGKLPSQDAIDQVKSLAVNVQGVQSVDVSGLVVAGG